jgi:hypothetical protein
MLRVRPFTGRNVPDDPSERSEYRPRREALAILRNGAAGDNRQRGLFITVDARWLAANPHLHLRPVTPMIACTLDLGHLPTARGTKPPKIAWVASGTPGRTTELSDGGTPRALA